MDRFRRIHEILRLLKGSERPVPTAKLLGVLECKRHTLYRAAETARATLDAPIIYDSAARGWRLERKGAAVEAPGLWFEPEDLLLLLAVLKLLGRVSHGLLKAEAGPFEARLKQILKSEGLNPHATLSRVRLLPMDDRKVQAATLRACAEAITSGRRLRITYDGRERGRRTERSVSPQHIVLYRDNWYLDAFCHEAGALRIFSLDRIASASPEKRKALRISEKRLAAHYASAYGIFAGPATKTAVIRFTKERAKWVSAESWHPRQKGRFLKDGRYELRIPYGDQRELLMDILRHGAGAEVVAPQSLRDAAASALKAALRQYQ